MADTKISALTAASALTGAELVPVVQSGANRRTTITDILALLLGTTTPAALNTLDELAAALGDDANFATTVTNALANKQALNGMLTAIASGAIGSVASAATTDVGAVANAFVTVTGTTGITSLGNAPAAGIWRVLRFTGVLTWTHNGTSMILPNNAGNISTADGDLAFVYSINTTGGWRCAFYQRASGQPLAGGASLADPTFSGLLSMGDGAENWTAYAMPALAIDVTKRLNTKSVSADTTFTFSGVPSTSNRVFGLLVANTGSSAITVTIPSSVPNGGGAAITTFVLAAGTRIFLSWRYDGTDYTVMGVPGVGAAFLATLPTDDTYQGDVITGKLSAAALSQWDAVYLTSAGKWAQADANGTGTYPARGLAVAAAGGADTAVNVLVRGNVRNDSWAWTPGGTIYLSGTAGGLTQTVPSTSGDKVQAVGYALDADHAFFDFDTTFVQVA